MPSWTLVGFDPLVGFFAASSVGRPLAASRAAAHRSIGSWFRAAQGRPLRRLDVMAGTSGPVMSSGGVAKL